MFKIMKTHFKKTADRRRANFPDTKSWTSSAAVWLAMLLAHIGLATVQAAPEIVAWGVPGGAAITSWAMKVRSL